MFPYESLLFDESDRALVESHSWWLSENGYAVTDVGGRKDKRRVYLHRLLMGEPEGQVDHVNRDRLDNRRANLRVATHAENCRNASKTESETSSRFKGVRWHKGGRKWSAQIKVAGLAIHLGLHESEIDAAKAYDAAALRYFGIFAATNLPA